VEHEITEDLPVGDTR